MQLGAPPPPACFFGLKDMSLNKGATHFTLGLFLPVVSKPAPPSQNYSAAPLTLIGPLEIDLLLGIQYMHCIVSDVLFVTLDENHFCVIDKQTDIVMYDPHYTLCIHTGAQLGVGRWGRPPLLHFTLWLRTCF